MSKKEQGNKPVLQYSVTNQKHTLQTPSGPPQPSATVYTWGTKYGASDYGQAISARLEKGNPGHVSIAIQIPEDEKGKKLIEKYCKNIPHSIKKYAYSANPNDPDYYYEVYFSYFPPKPKEGNKENIEIGYSLEADLESDKTAARRGVHFNWEEKFLSDADIEIDYRHKRTLGPAMVVHQHKDKEAQKLLKEYSVLYNETRRLENELYRINQSIKTSKNNPKKLEALKKIQQEINAEIDRVRDDHFKTLYALDDLGVKLEKYITEGSPPDNTIKLPVVINDPSKNPSDKALDLEKMLQGMEGVLNDKKYDRYRNNCSAAVAAIIYSGIPKSDDDLRKAFKAEGFLGVATPQTVFKAASKGQDYLTRHRIFSQPKSDKQGNISSENILEKFVKFLKGLAKKFQKNKGYELLSEELDAGEDSPKSTSKRPPKKGNN